MTPNAFLEWMFRAAFIGLLGLALFDLRDIKNQSNENHDAIIALEVKVGLLERKLP